MSLLRKQKFVVFVFTVLGVLILYNVWFFTFKKKHATPRKTPPQKSSAPATKPSPPLSRSGSKSAATSKRGSESEKPGSIGTVKRDPFLLADEEMNGKTMDTLWREKMAARDKGLDTSLHEVLAQLGLLKVSGILYDPVAPMAVVNNEIVRVGDSLLNGFFEIRSIQPDRIVVRHGLEELDITLPGVAEYTRTRSAEEQAKKDLPAPKPDPK